MGSQFWHLKGVFSMSFICSLLLACAYNSPHIKPHSNPSKTPTDRGLVITMESIFFDFDSAKLNNKALNTIASLAQQIKRENNKHYVIGIDGYTDIVGKEDYNLNLSKRRAENVKAAFMTQGIAAKRLDAKGFGQSDPIADNETSVGRQQNRRVEVLILQPLEIQRQGDF